MKTGILILLSCNFSGMSLIWPIINASSKTLDLWTEILIYKGSFLDFLIHTYSILVCSDAIVVFMCCLPKTQNYEKELLHETLDWNSNQFSSHFTEKYPAKQNSR